MEDYKEDFINFLLETRALKIGGDFKLKSGRISPWFVNMGEFNEALATRRIGEAYASALQDSGLEFDILYGIPEKGKALVVATAIAFSHQRPNLPWFSTRKEEKTYGEATDLTPEERVKAFVIGKIPQEGQRIAQLDDVITAGDAKYEARRMLESFGNFRYPILAIGVDRQEVGIDGKNAIKEYEAKTGTQVVSIVNAVEIYGFLKNGTLIPTQGLNKMADYLGKYGTDEVKKTLEKI